MKLRLARREIAQLRDVLWSIAGVEHARLDELGHRCLYCSGPHDPVLRKTEHAADCPTAVARAGLEANRPEKQLEDVVAIAHQRLNAPGIVRWWRRLWMSERDRNWMPYRPVDLRDREPLP